MSTVILLFALFTNPDGSKELKDLAVFGDLNVCKVVAATMNESPRKPEALKFSCREGALPVKS